MIKWQEAYSTGVVQIDEQHKNLFQYCNDLEKGLNIAGVSKVTLDGALRFLERYAKVHFSQEESCMHKYACPIAQKNKFAHQKFIDVYKSYQNIITKDGNNDIILRELHHFLETWLTDHICKIDTQLKTCVQETP